MRRTENRLSFGPRPGYDDEKDWKMFTSFVINDDDKKT